jgi:glutathione synthase
MNILYICSPFKKWEFFEDTTPLMITEARSRGTTTFVATPENLYYEKQCYKVKCREIEMIDHQPFYRQGDLLTLNLNSFQVIHLRTDPPFDLSYYYTTLILDQAGKNTLVVNNPTAVRSFNEKLAILDFPEFIAETMVTYQIDEIPGWLEKVGGRGVVKHIQECSSKGIVKISLDDPDLKEKLADIDRNWSKPVMVQRFLPQVVHGETRITMIGGKAAGYMLKTPAEGNFLASLDFKATVSTCELTGRDEEIVRKVGKFLINNGIILAALDIIDGHLSEINITSPGLLKHTNEVMGIKLESILEDEVERVYSEQLNNEQLTMSPSTQEK